MTREVWRDVVGYESLYQVSNMGRVRALDRVIERKDGRIQTLKGHMLTPCKGNGSYYNVSMCKDNVARSMRVHRLVAIAFIPNPNNYRCVNHKDGNKLNNKVSNLEWCTNRQNTQHAIKHKLITFDRAGYNSWPKESREHFSKIRKKAIVRSDGKVYKCTKEAAEDLGVTYSAVMHVLRGLAETCKGYGFTYIQ